MSKKKKRRTRRQKVQASQRKNDFYISVKEENNIPQKDPNIVLNKEKIPPKTYPQKTTRNKISFQNQLNFDLIKSVILTVILLGIIAGVYYYNQLRPFLDQLATQLSDFFIT